MRTNTAIPVRSLLAGAVLVTTLLGVSLARFGEVKDVGEVSPEGEAGSLPTTRASSTFVNFESPHVHPLDMTPDRVRLLAVNTAAARIEVYASASGAPRHIGSVAVGTDPVSVRARTASEAWVVNHVSDSISIVDLPTLRVVRTLSTADEPCDVVFAAGRAFVSCSQSNTIQVFDLANLGAAPASVAIVGEEPKALAVSPDGQTVYAAIFESGNRTTILGGGGLNTGAGMRLSYPPNVVGQPEGPYAGVNPPPNSGTSFVPAQRAGNPAPPAVGLIVKKDALGRWMDDNNHDWTDAVSGDNAAASGRRPGWDLADHDLAAINASSLSVSYATNLMNLCMGVGINPANGAITVIGTEALNHIRYEPNLKGRFIRVNMASVNPATLASTSIVDLNPHLTYATPSVPQAQRDLSIGDPRAIVWNAAGSRGYVAGLGSNNVIAIDAAGSRATPTIEVGEGPTGLVLDETGGHLYVLNRFDASISVVSTATNVEVERLAFFDPTPAAIKVGRKHLYDTHRGSGLGHIACASCHVDARFDRLAWDLGDPSGVVDSLGANNLGMGVPFLRPSDADVAFEPFHPMKGPMTTQTMQDIVGHEPHHWRGDRSGIEAFAPAFQGLQGDDSPLTTPEMAEFEGFLATIHYPPNPFRTISNGLATSLPLPGHYSDGRFAPQGHPLPNGNAVNGLALYRDANRRLDNGAFACVTCHTLPTGAGPDYTMVNFVYQPVAPGPLGERHRGLVSVDGSTNTSMKIPQTRNVHEKDGFNTTQLLNTAGFGYLHDGSVDSIERFVSEPVFTLTSEQEVADMVAFMLSFSGSDLPAGSTTSVFEPPGGASKDAHAAVGEQTTLRSAASPDPNQVALITTFISLANANKVGLIVKGRVGGVSRGWVYTGSNSFQSDRAGQTVTAANLQALAAAGSELTYTIVVKGTELRLGVDADADGVLDGDEAAPCIADLDNDGDPANGFTRDDAVDINDLLAFLIAFENGDGHVDLDDGTFTGIGDGGVDINDLLFFLVRFEGGC